MPAERNVATFGWVDSRYDIEERCLPGSIWADKPSYLTQRYMQVNVAERYQTTESHSDRLA